MNIEQLREYCIRKKAVEETFPFDNDTLVFKLAGKAFALTSLAKPVSVNLKCDPEKAIELRHEYHAVLPGWRMNKKHWNTVMFNEDMNDKEIIEWVEHSYNLVLEGLSKNERSILGI